jgi:hypothetical protein
VGPDAPKQGKPLFASSLHQFPPKSGPFPTGFSTGRVEKVNAHFWHVPWNFQPSSSLVSLRALPVFHSQAIGSRLRRKSGTDSSSDSCATAWFIPGVRPELCHDEDPRGESVASRMRVLHSDVPAAAKRFSPMPLTPYYLKIQPRTQPGEATASARRPAPDRYDPAADLPRGARGLGESPPVGDDRVLAGRKPRPEGAPRRAASASDRCPAASTRRERPPLRTTEPA